MFAGIVEAKTELLEITARAPSSPDTTRIILKKPQEFNDLSVGDSIAVNGVCLTVEAFDATTLQFALGAETLKITGWNEASLRARPLNLERSLRVQDRVHGHFVSGHVDALGRVIQTREDRGSLIVQIEVPLELQRFIWPKGSVAVNGVSLTLNGVQQNVFDVCLIPETLKRTNLALLQAGDFVTIEVDPMARGIARFLELERRSHELHN